MKAAAEVEAEMEGGVTMEEGEAAAVGRGYGEDPGDRLGGPRKEGRGKYRRPGKIQEAGENRAGGNRAERGPGETQAARGK